MFERLSALWNDVQARLTEVTSAGEILTAAQAEEKAAEEALAAKDQAAQHAAADLAQKKAAAAIVLRTFSDESAKLAAAFEQPAEG